MIIDLKSNINKLEEVMKIWLETNIDAHDFICKEYWIKNYDLVRELLKEADVYIFEEDDEQIQLVSGLDHPFALSEGHDNAGFLYDQHSGRFLLFKTEAPCFVVYTANFVDESVLVAGKPMIQHNGIALEAQALPDAIHSDLKDQVILKAGQTFTSKTRYELVVK